MININELIDHVKNKIKNSDIIKNPYYHLFITDIFTNNFYNLLKKRMIHYKYNCTLEDRNWDNDNFINKKYHLTNNNDYEIEIINKIFSNVDIQYELFKKFYVNPEECDNIIFMHDFQFVFTDNNRFQNIHTDIPSQYLSLIFYLPESTLTPQDEIDNGTIMYDKNLNICKDTRFIDNSLCCFAPHLYSYHGFNTTIENRNTMLFFYSQKEMHELFYYNVTHDKNMDPENFKNEFEEKLKKYKFQEN